MRARVCVFHTYIGVTVLNCASFLALVNFQALWSDANIQLPTYMLKVGGGENENMQRKDGGVFFKLIIHSRCAVLTRFKCADPNLYRNIKNKTQVVNLYVFSLIHEIQTI